MRIGCALFALGTSWSASRAQAQEIPEPFPFIDWAPTPKEAPRGPTDDIRRFTAKLGAGSAVWHVYDNFVYGADFTLALGGNARGHPGHYHALINATVGRTIGGLLASQVHLGFLPEWSVSRVRLGFTGGFGVLLIERATSGSHMVALLVGFTPHVSVDLLPFEDALPGAALYLMLRGGVDFAPGARPAMTIGGATLALGVRF